MRLVILATLLLSTAASAQQADSSPQAQAERSQYLLQALESQRNDALAKLAFCSADANTQIAALKKQLDEAHNKLAATEQKTDPEKKTDKQ